MNLVKKGITWVDRLNAAIGLVSGISIVAAMVAIVWEVVARYIFNSPTIWAGELTATYLLPATIFLGAAYTLQVDGFIRIDVFFNRFSRKKKAVFNVVAYIAGLIMVSALIWRGWELFYRSYVSGETTTSTLLNWPIFPSQAMIWLGCLFLLLELIIKIYLSIESLFTTYSKT